VETDTALDAAGLWSLNLAIFNVFYGMFPHSFLRSLQVATSTQKDAAALTVHIQAFLQRHAVHPALLDVTTPEAEAQSARFDTMEPQDIVAECTNLLLAPPNPETTMPTALASPVATVPQSPATRHQVRRGAT